MAKDNSLNEGKTIDEIYKGALEMAQMIHERSAAQPFTISELRTMIGWGKDHIMERLKFLGQFFLVEYIPRKAFDDQYKITLDKEYRLSALASALEFVQSQHLAQLLRLQSIGELIDPDFKTESEKHFRLDTTKPIEHDTEN